MSVPEATNDMASHGTSFPQAPVKPPGSVTATCLELLGRSPPGVVETVSPRDHMHKADPGSYMRIGQLALDVVRLAMLSARKSSAESILDLGSGHGRVLRFLKAEFPDAELTACDIDPDAIEFCAVHLGATPVLGKADAQGLAFDRTFDLIWCGSLLTHVDEQLWAKYLDHFEAILRPGGVFVATTQGRSVADRLRDNEIGNYYMQSEARRAAILQAYADTGFGYADYDYPDEFRESLSLPRNFGLTLVRPSYVCGLLEKRSAFRVLMYTESGWGGEQDVVACVRTSEGASGETD